MVIISYAVVLLSTLIGFFLRKKNAKHHTNVVYAADGGRARLLCQLSQLGYS